MDCLSTDERSAVLSLAQRLTQGIEAQNGIYKSLLSPSERRIAYLLVEHEYAHWDPEGKDEILKALPALFSVLEIPVFG